MLEPTVGALQILRGYFLPSQLRHHSCLFDGIGSLENLKLICPKRRLVLLDDFALCGIHFQRMLNKNSLCALCESGRQGAGHVDVSFSSDSCERELCSYAVHYMCSLIEEEI